MKRRSRLISNLEHKVTHLISMIDSEQSHSSRLNRIEKTMSPIKSSSKNSISHKNRNTNNKIIKPSLKHILSNIRKNIMLLIL